MKNNVFRVKVISLFLVFSLCLTFSISAQSESAQSLFSRAHELQEHGKWYDAVDLYQEALTINPQYGDVLYNLSVCHYALGSYDLAVQYADSAAKYSRNQSDIQNLKGLSLIALGKVEEARKVFDDILEKFPNDVNARFGLAELDLLDGRISVAEGRYLDALKRDSKNRKALLSLALVSAETGKVKVSENYIRQALSYYSGEPEVHYMASYLSAKNGDYKTAETRARSAVSIDGDFDKAYSLLAQILYAQERYEEVIDICDFRIGRDRNSIDAWYLKGRAHQRLSEYENAIESYERGLSIEPQDEVMRSALEQLVCDVLAIEEVKRNDWASFHYGKAKEYGRNFDGIAERYEYQKAITIAPLSSEIRQSFAEMLERNGHYELYLQQLKFMKENEVKNSDTSNRTREEIKNDDAIESFQSLLRNNIGDRWEVDPFYLDKTRWNIGLYFTRNPIQLFHSDLEEVSAVAAKEIFNGVPSAYVDVQYAPVLSYGEAFRLAREAKRDYFVVLSASETERTYSIDAKIYSARTGTETTEIHIYRTGNDRMAKSMQRFRQAVLDILPIRGKVLGNVQGKLLLDLGKNDGILSGSEFDIVRKGCVVTKDAGPGITYNKKDFIGTVTVTSADEELSEGEYKKGGFYDTLNAGDEIILTKNPETEEKTSLQDNRPAADSNGEPATEEARKAELESIKESLRPTFRENDLIHLIRTIL